MKTTTLIARTVIVAFALVLPTTTIAKKPNVLFIFTDDQRPDAIGAVGNRDVITPHMDELIESGFLFDQAYVQGGMTPAVCLPSRAMLMSGKSLFRAPRFLDQGTLLPQVFQKAGYKTFATGKWHNGRESFVRCFDQAEAIFFGGAARTHVNFPVERMVDGQMVEADGEGKFSTELFANKAIEFLKQQKGADKPFFCYIPFTAPHSPHMAPREYVDLYDPSKITLPPNYEASNRGGPGGGGLEAGRRMYAEYYAMITHLDHHIGRILTALKESGLYDDTIIVFATDHGMAMNSHGYRGKTDCYEHTSRAVINFTGPGIPKGKKSDALVYLYDIYPTLCGLTELDIPSEVEGKDLNRIIQGETGVVRDHLFTAYLDSQRAIRYRRWKILKHLRDDRVELYDLENDPHELNDLAGHANQKQRVESLLAALTQAREAYGETPKIVQTLMRIRGGGGGRRGGFGPQINANEVSKQLAAKVFDAAKKSSTDSLSQDEYETVWMGWFESWLGENRDGLDRPTLAAGLGPLISNRPSERPEGGANLRRGGPGFAVARAVGYSVDQNEDRVLSRVEFFMALIRWFEEADQNDDSELTHQEVQEQIESVIESAPQGPPRGRR